MEYLSRLSGLVTTPAKAAAGITASPRLKKKPSLHPVGSVDVFHADWEAVKLELQRPDERALFFGVARSDLPRRLQRIVDALVFESNRSNDDHTGPCMEYMLKYDILTELVNLSAEDRPKGIKGETIRSLTNLIILLDEKFLSRRAVHKPISQLIQLCLDEDATRFQLDDSFLDNTEAPASNTEQDYEEDLVDLMCHIASRIRNTPDLLQIFFSDEPVDDHDNYQEVRSLRDGSIIVSRHLIDPTLDAFAEHDAERPPSPANSVDSTATVQPTKSGWEDTGQSSRRVMKRRLRFPLFSYLLKFVHREGRIGELARAGLLFLISLEGAHATESNSASVRSRQKKAARRVSFETEDIRRSLAVFIAHSDFADVLGAGLGAAYGLLPSRIRPRARYDPAAVASSVPSGSKESTITLGSGSRYRGNAPDTSSSEALASATVSDDPGLQSQLRLVVDLIEFCQDVLDSLWLASRHLKETPSSKTEGGPDSSQLDPMIRKLARAIAIAIRDTFIRNVIYPSLMESSDFDGSATAVLSYLDVMVIVLRNGHILTEVVLDYLLANDAGNDEVEGYNLDVPKDEADRYSIKDLILDNLASNKRTATRVAALKFARSLITFHGHRAIGGILTIPRQRRSTITSTGDLQTLAMEEYESRDKTTRIDGHLRELDQYSALLSSFGSAVSAESLQASLSPYLIEAEQGLRQDSTFSAALNTAGYEGQIKLVSTDALVQQLFESIAELFLHPVEVNLAVTGLISALATSPIRNLQGWFTYGSGNGDLRSSKAGTGGPPALLDLLRSLTSQVEAYRNCVPDFDRYLEERRRGLVMTEDITEALEADDSFESDDVEQEKGAAGSTSAEPSSTRRKLQSCLSLPRPPIQSQGGRLQTSERKRAAERDFGILEDRRSELLALQQSIVAASAGAGGGATSGGDAEEVSRSEQEPRASALARLFGGRPVRASAESRTTSGEIRPGVGTRKVSSSTINPYADHYRQTMVVSVKAKVATGAQDWRPEPTVASSAKKNETQSVTLSSVLDNTILLEELIKEVVAIIIVRRGWGMDPLVF